MCEYFVNADPILYESRTRTVRIRGVSTSIRMENFVWDTLAKMAAEEGVTTNALIVQFHDEILRHRGDVQNFTSFLRVTCLRFLDRQCANLEMALAATQEETEESQDLVHSTSVDADRLIAVTH
ncbi:MAG: ribbon-helix-helix domain-containing protein [Limnohabitans sp.]